MCYVLKFCSLHLLVCFPIVETCVCVGAKDLFWIILIDGLAR